MWTDNLYINKVIMTNRLNKSPNREEQGINGLRLD